MKVQKFLQEVVESLGATVTDAGVVLNPATQEPYQIGEKDVVIPLKTYLEENMWDTLHPFHPLCEDVMLGQSPTYHFMLRLWRANTTIKFLKLIKVILDVAADPKLSAEVKDPAFAKLPIPKVKETTIAAWKRLMARFAKEHFLKLYVSRSEDIDGEKFLRRADLNIPLLETEGGKPFGVQASIPDSNTIRELVEFLFRPMLKPMGSNHAIPYLDVLLQMQMATAKQYNKYVKMLSKVQKLEPMPTGWFKEYPDMDKFRKHIPKLSGNEGVKLETSSTKRNSGVELDDELYEQANVTVRKPKEDQPPFEPDPPRRDRGSAKSSGLSLSSMLKDKEELSSGGEYDRRYTERPPLDLFDRRDRNRRDDRESSRGRDTRRSSGRRDERRRSARDSGGGFTLSDFGI